jgi:hypothetical protein
MTTAAVLTVDLYGKNVNLTAVLARAHADLLALNATGQTVGGGLGGTLAGGARQASGSFLALQQAAARLEVAEGNVAGAAARLRNALATQTTTTTQVINARRQLIAVEHQLATGQSGLARAFSEAGAAAKSSLLGIVGPAALATAGVATATSVVKSFFDAFKFKAELDATTASINAQLKGVRDTSVVYAEASAFADKFKLTQQETTSAIQASIGVMRSSKASVEDIIGVLARMQVLSPEQQLSEAAFALKALSSGDTQSLVTRFEVSRDVANQMKAEIQGGADAVAVMSKFLTQSGIGMDTLAAKTEGAAGKMKDLAIAQERVQLAQAKFAEGPGITFLETKAGFLEGLTATLEGNFDRLADANLAFAQTLIATGDYSAALAARSDVLNQVFGQLVGSTFQVAQATALQASVSQQAAQTGIYQSDAMIGLANAQQHAQQAAQANAQALVEQSQKTIDAAIQSQNLAQFQATLARLGGAVAGGHLTAANGAAQLANMYGIATSKAYELVFAQSQLAGIQAKGAVTAADGVAQHTARLEAQGAHYKAIRAAQEQQTAQIGTAAQKQALLNAQLERARVTYGQTSVEFIRADTALKQFQASQAKAPKGGGGGAVKLSDQAKLNNSLLADQTKYENKSEDETQKYVERLLDIDRDFAEKRRQAEQNAQLSRLDSEASFYDALGALADHGLQQVYSAQYEAALLEAEKIAAEKGADVGEAYMKEKEAALKAQATRAQEITEAETEGDGAKAEFLKGVDEKYRKAEERRVEMARQGDDSVAAQHQKALDEETARYDEQVGKVTTAAERAALAKITAAERGGKAVDTEKLSVDNLVASYEKLGTVSTRGATATTPPTTAPAAPGATTTPTAAPVDLSALLSALQGVGAQVTAATQAVERAVRDGSSQVAGAMSGKAFG